MHIIRSKGDRAREAISLLRVATRNFPPLMSTLIKQDFGKDPFIILISCLLSLRSRDTQTYPIAKKLFQQISTPEELLTFGLNKLEALLRPLGFFKKKSQVIKAVSQELITKFASQVPSTRQALLSLPGVGPKTANLVLGEAFDIPALCVDVHVHRLSNRWGLVKTNTPEETEEALCMLLPEVYWIEINKYFVMWGQNERRRKK